MAEFYFVDIDRKRYTHDREPNECPICHFAIHPNEGEWTLVPSTEGPKRILEIIFRCPRRECGHFFIARYRRDDAANNVSPLGPATYQFVMYEVAPSTPPAPRIPKEVSNISPLFPEIYSQSLAAESFGLVQVAGVGYRKALEFVIKDFCIASHPQSANEISSMFLSACIDKFVTSPDIKICAKRAAWLGNDETHYVRRWVDKDIENLKELILLTVNWIHSSILTQKYEKEMQ
jgi:hypothetical protein